MSFGSGYRDRVETLPNAPRPFAFTCPFCHVPPGAFCVTNRGRSRQLVHAQRMDVASAYRAGGHAVV